MTHYLKNKKGSILITSYLVIATLLVFGGSYLSSVLSQLRACDAFIDNAKAFHAAELALADAFWRHDNYLPLPVGPIFVEGNTFAFIENVDSAFATFTAQSVGFVTNGVAPISADATYNEVTQYMRTSKRLQNRGMANSMLNVMTVGGHSSEVGNLIIQPTQTVGADGAIVLTPGSGTITINGNMVLLGHVNKQDAAVTVNFDPAPAEAVNARLVDSMFLDANKDAAWEPSDLVTYMNLAEEQFSAKYPDTVVKIAIPQSNFLTAPGAQVLYTLQVGALEPDVRTVLIYPDSPNANAANFGVVIAGTLASELDRTFIVAGNTEVAFTAATRNADEKKSRVTIMSWGDIMLGQEVGEGSDKADIGLLAISHSNIKIKAKTESVWNASLFADKDVIITTAPNTNFTLNENKEMYYQREPDLLRMTIPSDLTPYLYVAPEVTPVDDVNILSY